MFKKLERYLRSPYYALGDDLSKTHPEWMSDRYFIRVFWHQMFGYPLDLKHPATFNEKIQWMKLYDHDPRYPDLIDKYKVKEWVKRVIGEQYVIPTLAVYDTPDDITLEGLPDQFVLKCNHDSGGLVICRDKDSFDLEAARKVLWKSFDYNFFDEYREWPYKMIGHKVFAEAYIVDSASGELPDYKFFTFGGKPHYLFIATGRQSGHEVMFDFFDMDGKRLPVRNVHPNNPGDVPLPATFETMKELAAKLAADFQQVRVDFYEADGKCYFGEMTFFHGAGYMPFTPHSFDREMGDLWTL